MTLVIQYRLTQLRSLFAFQTFRHALDESASIMLNRKPLFQDSLVVPLCSSKLSFLANNRSGKHVAVSSLYIFKKRSIIWCLLRSFSKFLKLSTSSEGLRIV